jgi:hypothetical protein
MEDYEDIRQFDLLDNSAKLIYIYLSSLLNDKIPVDAVQFLKSIPNVKSIDVVVFCSFTSDINRYF